MLGYAFILTHPGSPCVFYEHLFNWGLEEEITQLVSNVCFLVLSACCCAVSVQPCQSSTFDK